MNFIIGGPCNNTDEQLRFIFMMVIFEKFENDCKI